MRISTKLALVLSVTVALSVAACCLAFVSIQRGALRRAEIAVPADDGAEHRRRKLTEQGLARRLHLPVVGGLTASRAGRS